MNKVIENRNDLATKQQVIDASIILRDFLQEKGVALDDIYRFLHKKKLSVLGLEKTKNQFIDYSIYNKETELVKEFFEEVKITL